MEAGRVVLANLDRVLTLQTLFEGPDSARGHFTLASEVLMKHCVVYKFDVVPKVEEGSVLES